jgi:hypothetical protein
MTLKTLNLHEIKHQDVEETVASFLNWSEVPCRIITGNSNRMKKLVKEVVDRYGYSCYNESAVNHGSLIVVEEVIEGFE